MKFGSDNSSWTAAEAFAASTSYALPSGDGTKTVYVKLIDSAGNESVVSDSIILDTTPPTGTIAINNGDVQTKSTFVNLTLTCADATSGCAQMQFSNDNSTWSPVETYATSKKWTLNIPNGTKTVWAKFKDNAGNWSITEIKDDISLATIFSDDMESGSDNWFVSSNWVISNEATHSGSYAWTDSPGGNYTDNTDASLTSVSFSTVGLSSLRLNFWHKFAISSNDYAKVEISNDNGATWTEAASYGPDQYQDSWAQTAIDLSSYVGYSSVKIRFRLQTTYTWPGNVADGWHIDDVRVQEAPVTTTLPFNDDMEGDVRNWLVSSHWVQTTLDKHSGATCWTDSPGKNYTENTNANLTTLPFSTVGLSSPRLSFWQKYSISSNDYAKVELTKDSGITWTEVASYGPDQYQNSWAQTAIDLSTYVGYQYVQVRFRITTVYTWPGNVADGWYIDDVKIWDPATMSAPEFGNVEEQNTPLPPDNGSAANGESQAAPAGRKGEAKQGCFIATAAYGSYLDPHVSALREFRDRYLVTNPVGRAFVALYCRYSPPIAGYINQYRILRFIVRLLLTPVVMAIEYSWFVLIIIPVFLGLFRHRQLLRRKLTIL